ncbi:unnamed protein product [Sphagnum jensenii]|uniref:Bet v I/Major latex protein domain-containing protein n=1 Tax=Sphagnum jensenii TaxID=128206 RepID=A0ABP1AQR7_9BRYO
MMHTVSHTEVLQCSADDMTCGRLATIAELSVGEIKERIDKIDDANKTLSTTVLEGDPRYSSFSAEIKFVPVGDTRCEAVWTATFLKEHGEAGSNHAVKVDPMFPDVEEVSERMDFVDDANKTLGYTVVEGSPGYHYFNVGLKFALGATAGTTDATWATTYVPMADM